MQARQPRKSVRVLFVHSRLLSCLGGAEISLRHHVENAPPGVEVVAVLPDSPVSLRGFDAVLLANLRPAGSPDKDWMSSARRIVWDGLRRTPLRSYCYRSQLAWTRLLIEKLSSFRGGIVRAERDVHPCAGRDGRCLTGSPIRRQPCSCGDEVPRVFEQLYDLAHGVIFLSPLHSDAINRIIRVRAPQHIVAVPIDFSRFRSTTPWEARKRSALITGDSIRVRETAARRALDNGFQPERIEYLSLPHDKMPELLNQYQAVVVDPVMIHAFGRLAAEALACGCRVLASERVGAMSWPEPLQACRRSNEQFWDIVPAADRTNSSGTS